MNRSSNSNNGNFTASTSSSNYNSNVAVGTTCNDMRYTIKKGDTLYSISRKYDIPLAMILRANPYVDVYNLQIGQSICIPTTAPVIDGSGSTGRPPVAEGPGPVVRPPVVESPGPAVRPPVVEGPGTAVRPPRPQGPGTAVRPSRPQGPGPAVRPSRPQGPGPVIQPRMTDMDAEFAVSDDMAQTAPVQSTTLQTTTSSDRRTEIGRNSTINFNYYGAPERPRREKTNLVMPRQNTPKRTESVATRTDSAVMTPATPARKKAQVRQTMPATNVRMRQAAPARQMPQMPEMREAIPVRQTMPAEARERVIPRHYMEFEQENPVKKVRMVAPVRVITKPEADNRYNMETEIDNCGRWSSYQDRERFNTIMNNTDNTNGNCCKKVPSCTQSVTKPQAGNCQKRMNSYVDSDDKIAIVSYVSKDNDTLQDVLDYFTMDVVDLFQYNVPNTIRLKPGCMINVPGRGEDK